LQAPFGPNLLIGVGPFNGVIGDATNVATEDRYYIGFDARYRIGNLSLEPSFRGCLKRVPNAPSV
jgi:hypothetical protein